MISSAASLCKVPSFRVPRDSRLTSIARGHALAPLSNSSRRCSADRTTTASHIPRHSWLHPHLFPYCQATPFDVPLRNHPRCHNQARSNGHEPRQPSSPMMFFALSIPFPFSHLRREPTAYFSFTKLGRTAWRKTKHDFSPRLTHKWLHNIL